MAFLSVTPGSLSVTNEIAKRDFTYVRTYVLAEIRTRISCLALMRSAIILYACIETLYQYVCLYIIMFIICLEAVEVVCVWE